MRDVTRFLNDFDGEDPSAADQLLPLVYQELRKLAAHRMNQESDPNTLQPTALVHEAWLRLTAGQKPMWENRAHFFGAAAEAMRRILIENARRRHAVRHGGKLQRVDIEGLELAAPEKDEEMLEINDALEKFARVDPQKAELVKLRYFVGLSLEEAAQILGMSAPTAKRNWSFARAWLQREIRRQAQPPTA